MCVHIYLRSLCPEEVVLADDDDAEDRFCL